MHIISFFHDDISTLKSHPYHIKSLLRLLLVNCDCLFMMLQLKDYWWIMFAGSPSHGQSRWQVGSNGGSCRQKLRCRKSVELLQRSMVCSLLSCQSVNSLAQSCEGWWSKSRWMWNLIQQTVWYIMDMAESESYTSKRLVGSLWNSYDSIAESEWMESCCSYM